MNLDLKIKRAIKDSLYCHLPNFKECPDEIAEAVLQSISLYIHPVVLRPSDAEIDFEARAIQSKLAESSFAYNAAIRMASWFRSQIKAVVLPERKREETPLDCSNDAIYRLGFNACLDEIESANL